MRYLFFTLALCVATTTYAQNFESVISNYLDSEAGRLDFNRTDLNDFVITDQSFSKSMDLYNVYVQQAYQGVPILNAIGSFAIKQNRVFSFKHSFLSDIDQKVETTTPSFTPQTAIHSAIEFLDLDTSVSIELKDNNSNQEYIFESENLSDEVIPVNLMYVMTDENKLRLAWDLSILTHDESHWWSVSVDANTGEILRQNDWMLSCAFDSSHSFSDHTKSNKTQINQQETLSFTNDGSQYRAYPLGVESPNHGNRVLLSQPADAIASPFGWHDTDGIAGAEFTITRGNNVLASEDRDADNIPGFSADGGTDLNFDFPIDDLPAFMNEEAAITNLFVWNNFMHDVWFHQGFDEASGNFQQTNYSDQGIENDFVIADAQDGAGLNNANFGTPPEGFNPRMQMFLWTLPGSPNKLLNINPPSSISGEYFGVQASFGPRLTPTPITSNLVLIEDDNASFASNDTNDACDNITNPSALNAKIVVIKRGECTFVEKIEKAQNNGALAVIMINNVFGNPISMGGDGSNITIPSIMISMLDGNAIITKLQNGETVNATLINEGPFRIDGDFDNGIIAHEYGHGISTRLTGGPQQSNCLFNDEQMGEGWSDWFGLMMTMQPGDTPEMPRGYGTFAISQPITGNGIRPARYTTDLNVNPATFDTTNDPNISMPHGVGFVWATMLWDLTWELIDRYGYDPDLFNGNGGNNLAMQLVVDALKLQSCNPGFIDARDAILQADMLANNGANQCYIWKVFANRGLGFSADQGSPFDRGDQVEAFDLPSSVSLPCQELSVETFNENTIKLYPNPSDDILNIESFSGTIGKANLKIYDLKGRLLINQTLDFNQTQQLNVSHLQTGVYLVKIENGHLNISKKLIVN